MAVNHQVIGSNPIRGCLFKMFNNLIYCNAATAWQSGFQEPATPIMEGIINFHHDIMFFLIFIFLFVSWMLGRAIFLFANRERTKKDMEVYEHNVILEIIWTIIPILILSAIALPSLALLYAMEEAVDFNLTVKAIGHQWYWSYEIPHDKTFGLYAIQYDSYMIPTDELQPGFLRLLEVDNRLVLPVKLNIRLLISSADVLHSWAVPSFGIKLDACPGRLNQATLFIKRTGIYFGQCSEICGINHAFMPIVVTAVPQITFRLWLDLNLLLEIFEKSSDDTIIENFVEDPIIEDLTIIGPQPLPTMGPRRILAF